MNHRTRHPILVGQKGPEIFVPSGPSRAGLCGRLAIGQSAAFRLGLMLGAGGLALAVMVLISLINPSH